MNVSELHKVMQEINIAQTWCDGDGTHMARVAVSKGKLREWARRIENALQNSAVEYRIVLEDHSGHEHTREITFRDWGINQNWPANADNKERLKNALQRLEDYRRFKHVYAENARVLWLEQRYVGPWERVDK